AYFRGELPAGKVAHPLTAVVERAEALYRERKLDEAKRMATQLIDAEATPPLLRSRSHVLLGWIALKEGNGRRALDHFSQVQGFTIPAQAAAAAFSLIGDEHRAIPLWAQAYAETPDPLVLHEYAGALLRGGREAEARALPGVNLARAWLAAERVFYVRKDFEAGARAAEAAFKEEPVAANAYTAACAYALAGKTEDALRMLQLASQNGYRDADEAERDADLKSLRALPDFQSWLSSLSRSPAS
ncbi:MAG: TPR end-of-group domain-containing protein, partial [Archangium sp.]